MSIPNDPIILLRNYALRLTLTVRNCARNSALLALYTTKLLISLNNYFTSSTSIQYPSGSSMKYSPMSVLT